MYDTLLFDFDGTLAPSLELWLRAFQYALRQYDCAPDEDAILKNCFYREYADVARDFNLPAHADLEPHVHAGLSRELEHMALYPGVRPVLDAARRAGLPMGLVTSSPRPQVENALARLGLDNHFGAIVTGTDITHYKPHPEPVLLALHKLGRPAQNCLFVGDWEVDILAGRAAGTHVALFAPPAHARFYDMTALRAHGADFTFEAWEELAAHLQL